MRKRTKKRVPGNDEVKYLTYRSAKHKEREGNERGLRSKRVVPRLAEGKRANEDRRSLAEYSAARILCERTDIHSQAFFCPNPFSVPADRP
ncbi:hypothetical protein [Spirochaeta dissipatitropha]